MFLRQIKQIMRGEMRVKRQAHSDENTFLSEQLANFFAVNVKVEPNAVIATYHAFRDELDPAPLNALLRARGHIVSLPLVIAPDAPLQFHIYEKEEHLKRNQMGMMEPDGTTSVLMPDLLLVPLLAFDARRQRLGYGGGFYDRTIAALRQTKQVYTIGLAYDYQEVKEVPCGARDIALDKIVTELRIL